jgi:hypothetical protein
MKLENENIIDILKENFEFLGLQDFFGLQFEIIERYGSDKNCCDVKLSVDNGCGDKSNLFLEVDTSNYDEKFADVNKYEVEDMGISIEIRNNEELEELNESNIWRELFFNK